MEELSMLTSDSIIEVTKALIEAQKELEAVTKSSANPFFKSKYADLNTILGEVLPVLSKHKLVLLQPTEGSKLLTFVIHESGQFVSSETDIRCVKPDDPQAYGSAISYARRYGLSALLSIRTEDDDGEKAQGRVEVVKTPKEAPKPKIISSVEEANKATDAISAKNHLIKKLYAIAYSKGIDANKKMAELVSHHMGKVLQELNESELETMIADLQADKVVVK